MANHAADNAGDRRLGSRWEQQFCEMAKQFHPHLVTAHQNGHASAAIATGYRDGAHKRVLLPDVTIWGRPEHHEIKHKNPTRLGEYGLEQYRFESLLDFARETDQRVLYTIHDWQLAGAPNSRQHVENRLEHWRTIDVRCLDRVDRRTGVAPSYCNGATKHDTQMFYWPAHNWVPLEDFWKYGTVVSDAYLDLLVVV